MTKHPYLHGFADLQKAMNDSVAEVSIPMPGVPKWNDYVEDFHGTPLLLSCVVAIDLVPAETAFTSVADTLAFQPLSQEFASETKDLIAELHRSLPTILDWCNT